MYKCHNLLLYSESLNKVSTIPPLLTDKEFLTYFNRKEPLQGSSLFETMYCRYVLRGECTFAAKSKATI